jgi:ABC-type lipoprotein release transport system permease subunit
MVTPAIIPFDQQVALQTARYRFLAVAASLVPALRAGRINPAETLKSE